MRARLDEMIVFLQEAPDDAGMWVHNLNPFLIQFSQNFGIRWYGLAYMTGFIAGAYLMIYLARRGRDVIREEQVLDYITYVVLGTMIGGRLGYAVFYSPDLLTSFYGHFPFWGVLAVWEGGMASHGGLIGVTFTAWLFARRHHMNWMHLGDLTTLGGAIGIFCGRIANFINGELMGRPCSPDLPWGVKFPQDMYHWLGRETENLPKLGAVVEKLGGSPAQWSSWVQTYRTNPESNQNVQGMVDQIIVAIQNGNEAVRQAMGDILIARHPSQLYEALLEGAFLFVVCFFFWRKPRKPGVIGALFLTLYAVVRIIGEHFRMPDAHLGFQLFGLTRGQWISIGQLLISVAILIWVSKRKADVIGGWGPEAIALKEASAGSVQKKKGKK